MSGWTFAASSLVRPKMTVDPWRNAGAANVERFETAPSVVAATPAAAPLRTVRRSIRDAIVGLASLSWILDSIVSSTRLHERRAVAIPNDVAQDIKVITALGHLLSGAGTISCPGFVHTEESAAEHGRGIREFQIGYTSRAFYVDRMVAWQRQ